MESEVPDEHAEVWEGDLLNRKAEADVLAAYIHSLGQRKNTLRDTGAYTIAVDAPYGLGKTFFLKRLEKQLAKRHPVAFIDAWADDLADEPLTALAATLKKALNPLLQKTPSMRDRLDEAVRKGGQVAKIALKGALIRGAGLLITASAAEAASQALSGSDGSSGVIKKEIEQLRPLEKVSSALDNVSPSKLMEDNIAEFEAGQDAIRDFKNSLHALVEALQCSGWTPPIVIIIDELDRCRPTYAVKLLEEAKHLFDVEGIVFVFGMNGDQLVHSVSGVYGASFDGRNYLRRFINRRYQLAIPDLMPLVRALLEQSGIDPNRLEFPAWCKTNEDGFVVNLHPSEAMTRYMEFYGLTARDAFHVVDELKVCAALTGSSPLLMAYLMPLIISHVLTGKSEIIEGVRNVHDFTLAVSQDTYGIIVRSHIPGVAKKLEEMSDLPMGELAKRANNRYKDALTFRMIEFRQASHIREYPLASPMLYKKLVDSVGSFS